MTDTLTYANVLASIKQVHNIMAEHTPMAPIRILENPLCVRKSDQPNRIHKVRRWMSDQYHYRIQKKWVKRFGYAEVPTAYILPARKTGWGDMAESCVIMHPTLARQLREHIRQEEWRKLPQLGDITTPVRCSSA